ncbi:hypothetical protein CWI36_0693p0010 [Hamiltosporidium magnivora]|uniref:Uncharacterized protein n=1 Tax=Hamiltosporidium magnivora TaxID=148818 RepID=A0A4Q9LBN4_9MICR|nr:hypothetical protein CWI36_0693p0010 [Hamiltosporidium magnivora]
MKILRKELDRTVDEIYNEYEDLALSEQKLSKFNSISEEIENKIIEKEKIEKELRIIEDQIKPFDFIDFLQNQTEKFKNINFETIITLFEEIKTANDFFIEQQDEEYISKCNNLNTELKNYTLQSIFDVIHHKPTTFFKNQFILKTFPYFTFEELNKIKFKYLRMRKTKCQEKIQYFREEIAILLKHTIKEEFYLYYKIFEEELPITIKYLYSIEDTNLYSDNQATPNIFECFVFSVLRDFVSNLDKEILEKFILENQNEIISIRKSKNTKIKSEIFKIDEMSEIERYYYSLIIFNVSLSKFYRLFDQKEDSINDSVFEV